MPAARALVTDVKRFPCQPCVSLLLLAVVLPISIAPPGLRHTHANGNRTHQHDDHHHGQMAQVGKHHAHPHDHENQLTPSSRHAKLWLLARSVPHVHWTFLGFHFTLPISGKTNSEGEDHNASLAIVVPTVSAIVLPESRLAKSDALPRLELRADLDNRINIGAASPFIPQAESSPLCDTARHERSGVQLI